MKNELRKELKEHLIAQLNLTDISPDEIGNDQPLFGEGLGLDSIDALEIIVILDNEYGLTLKNPEEGKDIFHSINTLADFLEKNKS